MILLLFVIPEHVSLWDKFPLWYHLTFLLSLIPLTLVGARLAGAGWRSQPVLASAVAPAQKT